MNNEHVLARSDAGHAMRWGPHVPWRSSSSTTVCMGVGQRHQGVIPRQRAGLALRRGVNCHHHHHLIVSPTAQHPPTQPFQHQDTTMSHDDGHVYVVPGSAYCLWGYAMAHGDRSVDVFVRKLAPEAAHGVSWSGATSTRHFGVGYRFAPEADDGRECTRPTSVRTPRCPTSTSRPMVIGEASGLDPAADGLTRLARGPSAQTPITRSAHLSLRARNVLRRLPSSIGGGMAATADGRPTR